MSAACAFATASRVTESPSEWTSMYSGIRISFSGPGLRTLPTRRALRATGHHGPMATVCAITCFGATVDQRLDLWELALQRPQVRRDGGMPVLAGERTFTPRGAAERPLGAVQRREHGRDAGSEGRLLPGGDIGRQTQ